MAGAGGGGGKEPFHGGMIHISQACPLALLCQINVLYIMDHLLCQINVLFNIYIYILKFM